MHISAGRRTGAAFPLLGNLCRTEQFLQLCYEIRVARLAFLTTNFTNLAFLEVVDVKKLFGFLAFFSLIFGFFWRKLTHAIRLTDVLAF